MPLGAQACVEPFFVMPNEEQDPRQEMPMQPKARSAVGGQMWAEVGRSREAGIKASECRGSLQSHDGGFLNFESSSGLYNEHNDILCCLGQQFVELLQIGENCQQDVDAHAADANSLKFDRLFNGRRTDLLVAAFLDLLTLWRRIFANLAGEPGDEEQESAETRNEQVTAMLADAKTKSRSRRRTTMATVGGEAVEIETQLEDNELEFYPSSRAATDFQKT